MLLDDCVFCLILVKKVCFVGCAVFILDVLRVIYC